MIDTMILCGHTDDAIDLAPTGPTSVDAAKKHWRWISKHLEHSTYVPPAEHHMFSHTYTQTHTQTRTHTRTHARTHARTRTHANTHTYVGLHMHDTHAQTNTTHTRAHTRTRIHTPTHLQISIYNNNNTVVFNI